MPILTQPTMSHTSNITQILPNLPNKHLLRSAQHDPSSVGQSSTTLLNQVVADPFQSRGHGMLLSYSGDIRTTC
jgi:hypothetical protein